MLEEYLFYIIASIYSGEREFLSVESAILLERAESALVMLHFLTVVVAYIALVRWYHRAYLNQERARVDGGARANWVAWSFFLPFVNLINPYRHLRHIEDGYNNLVDGLVSSEKAERLALGYWPLAWWLIFAGAYMYGRLFWPDEDAQLDFDALQSYTRIILTLGLISSASTVYMFRKISPLEDQAEAAHSAFRKYYRSRKDGKEVEPTHYPLLKPALLQPQEAAPAASTPDEGPQYLH